MFPLLVIYNYCLSTRSYWKREDHVHQWAGAGPLHAGRQHVMGQLRDQQRASGQDHADPVRHAEAGGEPGPVRLLGGQVWRAATLLHDFPRAAEHQVRLNSASGILFIVFPKRISAMLLGSLCDLPRCKTQSSSSPSGDAMGERRAQSESERRDHRQPRSPASSRGADLMWSDCSSSSSSWSPDKQQCWGNPLRAQHHAAFNCCS